MHSNISIVSITLIITLLQTTMAFSTVVDGKITKDQTACSESGLTIITETLLSPAYQGEYYSLTIEVEGGCRPFQYSYEGVLPDGLTFESNTGLISGIIKYERNNTGRFQFLIRVTDQKNVVDTKRYSIEIYKELSLISTTIKSGIIAYPFLRLISLNGGKRPYTYAISSGSLPEGLLLSEFGLIQGIPEEIGEFFFTIIVSDDNGRSLQQGFVMNIVEELVINTDQLYTAIVGDFYNFKFQSQGGCYGPYQWTINQILPEGLNLKNVSGVLSGVPKQKDQKLISIKVSDVDGHSATKNFLFNVADSLEIINLHLPPGKIAQEYNEKIMINGGIPPFTFSTSSNLPLNLTFDSNLGIIQGIPIERGVKYINVLVKDSSFPQPMMDSEQILISIDDNFGFITGSNLPDATQGIPLYNINDYIISVSGGSSPYTYQIISGYLPQGVVMSSGQSVKLIGTPELYGDFVFTLEATDSKKATTQKRFHLSVIEKIKIVTKTINDGFIYQPFNAILEVRGGVPPYSWSIVNGKLPSGLQLCNTNAVCSIRGLPAEDIYNSSVEFMVVDSAYTILGIDYQTFSFSIKENSLCILTKNLPETLIEKSYLTHIQAFGQPPFLWQLISGTLPAGLTIDFGNEMVSIEGKAEEAGIFYFTLQLSDLNPYSSSEFKSLSIVVHDVISIMNENLQEASTEEYYSQQIEIKNYDNSVSCCITDGILPNGLELEANSCIISGVPTADATSSYFCIKAIKAGMFGSFSERNFSIHIIEDPSLFINTVNIPSCYQNEKFVYILDAIGGLKPYQWYINRGQLPEGISCDLYGNHFLCQGTTTQCGNFEFQIKLMDNSMLPNYVINDYKFKVNCEKDELDLIPPSPPHMSYCFPEQNKWINGYQTVLFVPGQDQESGINGYSYEWNAYQTTTVDNTVETINTKIVSPLLPDGDHHYLHVASVDNAGNESETIHIGPFKVAHTKGHVLIVSAGDSTDPSWEVSKRLAEKAYHDFRLMGFTDDNIDLHIQSQHFFIDNDDIPDDVIDNYTLNAHEIVMAIKLAEHHVNETSPFIFYIQAIHSDNGMIKLSASNEYISAQEIDTALDWLQSTVNCQVIVIVESCFSSGFIQDLSGQNRTILTSADNQAYYFDSDAYISFSRFLFGKLLESKTLRESFEFSRLCMTHLGFPEPQMDDNGDGIFDHLDAAITGNSNIRITKNSGSFEKPDFFYSSVSQTNDILAYQTDITLYSSAIDVKDIFVQIIPPVINDFCGVQMFPRFKLNPLSANEKYSNIINNLFQSGEYKLVFHAINDLGVISDPKIYPLTVEQTIRTGDINGDQQVTLQDAIIGLQISSGVDLSSKLYTIASINQQHLTIGLPEIVFILIELSQDQ